MIDLTIRLVAVLVHLIEEQRNAAFRVWQNAVLGSPRPDAPLTPRMAAWGDGVGVGVLLAGLYLAGTRWPVAWALATGFLAVDAVAHVLGTVYALAVDDFPRWFVSLIYYRQAKRRSPGVVTSIVCYLPIVALDGHYLAEHPIGWLGGLPIVASWVMLARMARRWRGKVGR